MDVYHKIQTVYLRDPSTKYKTLLDEQWALPEFGYLADNKWSFTEKVDGTNIRVMVTPDGVVFAGKTDRAQLPGPLVERLNDRFMTISQRKALSDAFPDGCCLYGEGYGPKIQKAGALYREDQDFVLFDVRVGEWWLQRDAVEDVATELGLDVVPIIGEGTLHDMVAQTQTGFKSEWGDFEAEGIVARPKIELFTRAGNRIITKIKCRDFDR